MKDLQEYLENLSQELSEIAEKRLKDLNLAVELDEITFTSTKKTQASAVIGAVHENFRARDSEATEVLSIQRRKCKKNAQGQWVCPIS
jgi:polyisoprenoid-binding protein YceI